MKFLSLKSLILVGAGVVYIGGQYFRGVWFQNFPLNPCTFSHDSQGIFCDSLFADTWGWPLITAGEYLAIVGIIILFANRAGWELWLRVSYWFIPISIAIVAFVFPNKSLWLVPTDRTDAIAVLGPLYIILTAYIVLYGWWKGRVKNTVH